MGRPVDEERRLALLEAAADHLVEHGIADASLEAIARTAGTSARMLVHHFGSRDALVAGALAVARRRQLDAAARHFAPGPDAVAVLEAAWPWFTAPQTRRYFRLFQQVAALEKLEAPATPSELRTRLSSDWQQLFVELFVADPRHRDEAESLAELLLAVFRGLAIELVAQRDEEALARAFARFTTILRTADPQAASGELRAAPRVAPP